jgi:hypothetical protein
MGAIPGEIEEAVGESPRRPEGRHGLNCTGRTRCEPGGRETEDSSPAAQCGSGKATLTSLRLFPWSVTPETSA